MLTLPPNKDEKHTPKTIFFYKGPSSAWRSPELQFFPRRISNYSNLHANTCIFLHKDLQRRASYKLLYFDQETEWDLNNSNNLPVEKERASASSWSTFGDQRKLNGWVLRCRCTLVLFCLAVKAISSFIFFSFFEKLRQLTDSPIIHICYFYKNYKHGKARRKEPETARALQETRNDGEKWKRE